MERKKLTKSKAYYITQIIGGIIIAILSFIVILATKSSGIYKYPVMFSCLFILLYSFIYASLYYVLMKGCKGISFNSQEISYNYTGNNILVSLNKVRNFEVQGKYLIIVLTEVPTGNRIISGMLENKTIINEFIEYRKHAIEKYGIADDLASVL